MRPEESSPSWAEHAGGGAGGGRSASGQGHGSRGPGSRVMRARVTGPCGRGLSAHRENPWVSDESVTYSDAFKKIILPLCGK